MNDVHPAEDLLLDLAVDDLPEADAQRVVRHMAGCATCQVLYAGIAATVEHTLAATPRIEPRPGFDRTVLAAMGMDSEFSAAPRPRRVRTAWLAAAAVLVGLALGVGAAVALAAFDDEPSAVTAAAVDLRTTAGERVGSVTPSRVDGDRVYVVEVTDGVVGKRYECRLVLDDGRDLPAGDWLMEEPTATWVVRAPEEGVVSVELVTGTGDVWSSADLT
jgi:anti-sigma factor RsiW